MGPRVQVLLDTSKCTADLKGATNVAPIYQKVWSLRVAKKKIREFLLISCFQMTSSGVEIPLEDLEPRKQCRQPKRTHLLPGPQLSRMHWPRQTQVGKKKKFSTKSATDSQTESLLQSL